MSVRRTVAHLITGLTALFLLLACSVGDSGEGEDEGPGTVSLEAPTRAQLAEGVRLGDQTNQALYGVAADDETVAAVGYDTSSNVQRPLFATSTDAGETWRRGGIDEDSVPEGIGNAMARDVVAGDDGFVAIGWQENGRPALWSSTDGGDWAMQDPDDEAFRPADTAVATAWADGRYYIVGENTAPIGHANDRVIVWTSDDGEAWRRTDLKARVRDLDGTPYVADIAASGGQVLVAGGVENDTNTHQPNRIAIWRSADKGRTFHREQTSPTLGGDYRAYSRAVHVVDGDFQIAASGDGLDDSSWDTVILAERSSGWTTLVGSDLSSPQDEDPSALLTIGTQWVVGTNTHGTSDDARVYLGDESWSVERAKAPSMAGPGMQVVSDGAATGGAGVLVGTTARTGSDEPAVWRIEDGRVARVELPEELTEGRPSVFVTGLVPARKGYVAVGQVADSGVAWASDDFESWQPTGLEGREEYVPRASVADAVGRRDGSVIAVGSRARGNGDDAMVWVRDPDGDWHDKRSTELAERSDGGYGSILPTAVAAHGTVVVMAANAYNGGGAEIHPMVSRDGGDYWEAVDGSGTLPMTDNDTHENRSAWKSFRAPTNGDIGANDVVRSTRGWVMAGYRTAPGRAARPVVWLSRHARSWSSAKALPMPPQAHEVSVHHLAVRGKVLVAVGAVQRSESDAEEGWVSWVSGDGGKTWRVGSVHRDPSYVSDVIATRNGLLALGGAGPTGAPDAAAWSSTDGREWAEVDLGLSHADGRGSQGIVAGAVDGDRLRILSRDVPPEGGGVLAQTVPLPPL